MNKEGLDALYYIVFNCDYYDDLNIHEEIIEKELKDYYEIKEIAKHYNFEDLGHEVYKIDTDREWQLKFDAGIVSIQEDYRKARAFDIIKEICVVKFNDETQSILIRTPDNVSKTIKSKEQYDLLKEALLWD